MTEHTQLAYDDTGGSGKLLVMIPGAGDLRSEYRLIVGTLSAAGYRVVTADLPGHGESLPADQYTVASTATALVGLIEGLDAGPAVVVATSFAPAAAIWAATDRPDLMNGIVAISPHLHADPSMKGRMQAIAIKAALGGPWAGAAWAKFYASWYKAVRPDDLQTEIGRLRAMLAEPARRKAVRETLTADRDGVAERLDRLTLPTLTIMGAADDHFDDPAQVGQATAKELGGDHLLVEGAGHYPHVEQPGQVSEAILAFLNGLH